MQIKKGVYEQIIHFFNTFTETEAGGMLGSSDGKTIDRFFPDIDAYINTFNVYKPNIFNLNKQLEKWDKEKIFFCGIIHSHLTNTPELSTGDKKYIRDILSSTNFQTIFWFPVVLFYNNTISMYVYRAWLNPDTNECKIIRENIDIL